MRSERARARLVAGLGSIITLFSLMLAVDALQTVPGTSIAAHWPLDTSTTTTSDVAGVDNVATLVGSPPTVPALFGNGLQFASASSRRLTVPDHAELGIAATDSFSVGVWIKPSGTGLMRVMNKWNGTYGFHLDINAAAGGTASAGKVRLRVKDNATPTAHDHDYVVDGALGNNLWKHIAGVYDRTTKKAQIYVNGLPIGAPRDITNLTGTLVNTAIVEIGALANAGFFNGIMDEPILYRRALSAVEIQQLAAIPQGVTATTSQIGTVTVSWTAVPGANSYNILRSTTPTGTTTLATVAAPGTSFTDTVAAGTYYYVVQAVFTSAGGYTSASSTQVTGTALPPQVTALPATGLQTNENGASTGFTIKFNAAAPAGGSLVTVSSSNINEGVVSTSYVGTTATATGFQFTVAAGATPTIPVTVTGIDDFYADGNQAYTVTVTASGFTALTIPAVQCTNNDNDTPGVTISKTSGLVTNESGSTDKFTAVLNTRPFGNITMSLTSSLTTEGTVSPASLTFTTLNWNTPQEVTLTGVDDATLDFTIPYTIVTGTLVTVDTRDVPAYGGMNPSDVQAANVDDEVIPPAPDAWGGGGGCGLLGLEGVLAMALALLARRHGALRRR
jgi:hypothetical protein